MPQPGSTKPHATNPRQVETRQRRGAHRRPAPAAAAPPAVRRTRALDVNLTDEQKHEVRAMTPSERVKAMTEGRLTLGQETFWSRTHEREVPMLGNELAYIARYVPEYCEAGETEARS